MPNDLKLAFAFPPSSLDDLPAPISPTDQNSVSFMRFRHWLTSRLHTLRSLEPLGHRDLDRRRWMLIQRMVRELEGLSSVEMLAWEREKVLAGLYGFPDEATSRGPKVFQTGKLTNSRDLCIDILTTTDQTTFSTLELCCSLSSLPLFLSRAHYTRCLGSTETRRTSSLSCCGPFSSVHSSGVANPLRPSRALSSV